MKRASNRAASAAIALLFSIFLSSCITLSESVNMLASKAVSEGLISRYQAKMIEIAAAAANEATKTLTPEDEYYVGRAVAASIFQTYPPCTHSEINTYLNKLGQGLAVHSSKPEIFYGYRFLVLESPEVNAFATPGGHILITRGLLRLARDEDELAAVLAHEISHVALGHGLASVQGSRLTQIASEFAINAGKASGGSVAGFTSAFGDSIAEIAKILIVSGYSQTYEFQADTEAWRMLSVSGYDPRALSRLIERLPSKSSSFSAGPGFANTHPEPTSRVAALATIASESAIKASSLLAVSTLARQERFEAMRVLF